jgi:hypothetical protein
MNRGEDQFVKIGLTIGMRLVRQLVAKGKVESVNKIVVIAIICGKLSVNKTVDTLLTSTCLSVDCLELKRDRMSSNLVYIE